ncbi:hypothetical protein R6Q59_012868 [Mikania micrantha]
MSDGRLLYGPGRRWSSARRLITATPVAATVALPFPSPPLTASAPPNNHRRCPAFSRYLKIQRLINENPVVIFSRSDCYMCDVMKRLFYSIGVYPTVIELEDDEIADLSAFHRRDGLRDAVTPSVLDKFFKKASTNVELHELFLLKSISAYAFVSFIFHTVESHQESRTMNPSFRRSAISRSGPEDSGQDVNIQDNVEGLTTVNRKHMKSNSSIQEPKGQLKDDKEHPQRRVLLPAH